LEVESGVGVVAEGLEEVENKGLRLALLVALEPGGKGGELGKGAFLRGHRYKLPERLAAVTTAGAGTRSSHLDPDRPKELRKAELEAALTRAVRRVFNLDVPVSMATVMFSAVIAVAANPVVDVFHRRSLRATKRHTEMKSELRMSKSDTRPNSETPGRCRPAPALSHFGLRISFGFRISDFGF
jgi:hypothetical protein